MQVAQSNLRGHHSGLAYLSALLIKAKSEIASDGYMSVNIRKRIFFAFGLWDCLFALTCLNAGPPETKMEDRPSEEVVDERPDKKRADVVALIDNQLETISVFKGYALEREKLAGDAEGRSFSLPPAEAADKLLATRLT